MILKANDGMFLTNGETYGTTIHLGVNDKESNWYEITESEYQEIMAKIETEPDSSLDSEYAEAGKILLGVSE